MGIRVFVKVSFRLITFIIYSALFYHLAHFHATFKMIPGETENCCETAEATITTVDHAEKSKNQQETETASITAWKRYENFVSTIETMGGSYNRKLTLEAMFRGRDLVYVSH